MNSEQLKKDISFILESYSKKHNLQDKIDDLNEKHMLELSKLTEINYNIEEDVDNVGIIDNIIEYIKSCEIHGCISTTPGSSDINPMFLEFVKEHNLDMFNEEDSELITIFNFGKFFYTYYYLDDTPEFNTLYAEFDAEIIEFKDDYIIIKLLFNPGCYSEKLEFTYTLENRLFLDFLNTKISKNI